MQSGFVCPAFYTSSAASRTESIPCFFQHLVVLGSLGLRPFNLCFPAYMAFSRGHVSFSLSLGDTWCHQWLGLMT